MIDDIERTIGPKYHLERDNKIWMVEGIEIQAQDRHGFGFTLDKQESPPFAFLSACPPAYIAKMCDAIIVVFNKRTLYVFSIEKKTANKDDYRKQLTNGKLFCDWLFSLYREHGHHSGDPVHIGLLIWEPRRQPRKGTTTHGADWPKSRPNPGPFRAVFEAPNRPHVVLQDMIDQLGKTTG